MKALKVLKSCVIGTLKLSPVRAALYTIGKHVVIYSLKHISKNTKNTLDDKVVKKVVDCLK